MTERAAEGGTDPVTRWMGIVGVLSLLAAVLFAGVQRVADGAEHHSYNAGSQPAAGYQLTQGRQYQISVRGGLAALAGRGVDTGAPRCSWSSATDSTQPLEVTAIGSDARATHAVATFVAPATGYLHIDCADFGAVSIDDADNSTFDLAGLFVVLTTIALTLGVILGLGAAYRRSTARLGAAGGAGGSAGGAGEQDEVEGGVEPIVGH